MSSTSTHPPRTEPMPADLRRAVHQLVAEAAMNLQDVLRYTEPDVGQDWRRMTLYRSTDAADTVDMAALLIAAYLEAAGGNVQDVRQHLQCSQQQIRADGPRESDRRRAAALLGRRPMPELPGDGEEDPWHLWTQACLHGLRARSSDDLDSLDSFLPPHIAQMARRVAEALAEPQPATA
ncbi:hypothetical protein [Actinacidiphila yeochonensis]|uniref:hypothetical protein n=1 Tax=Actinacidiphila yeochonensis TaxID=89050 RepID=UPI001E5B8467|nr:hypothetical protein [Actinacidiphila yeochonensis]